MLTIQVITIDEEEFNIIVDQWGINVVLRSLRANKLIKKIKVFSNGQDITDRF